MTHTEELEDINSMLDNIRKNTSKNSIFKNCAKKRSDKELSEGVTFLSRSSTELPCDIIIDTAETYKYYNHPLCLWVVDGENVIPVTISDQPTVKEGCKVPVEVLSFIMSNVKTLTDVANIDIGGREFFSNLRDYIALKNQRKMMAEMSTYTPNDTGLSVWVYVDYTDSYLKSGHSKSYRMKFQQDKSLKNPRLWMPITIPELKIVNNKNMPPCKISGKEINDVLKWAKGNLNLLMDLKDHKIDSRTFEENMLTIETIKVLFDSRTS